MSAPRATPMISSMGRRSRCPTEVARVPTAEIGANTGSGLPIVRARRASQRGRQARLHREATTGAHPVPPLAQRAAGPVTQRTGSGGELPALRAARRRGARGPAARFSAAAHGRCCPARPR